MVGLVGSGKTTILYKLKLGEVITSTASPDFTLEEVSYKNVTFHAWDLGKPNQNSELWRHLYPSASGVIFVIDTADSAKIDQAREELHRVIGDSELKGDAVLLIYANKVDLPPAMKTAEVTEKLGLSAITDKTWMIQASCALTGDGLYEGLDWFSNKLSEKKHERED